MEGEVIDNCLSKKLLPVALQLIAIRANCTLDLLTVFVALWYFGSRFAQPRKAHVGQHSSETSCYRVGRKRRHLPAGTGKCEHGNMGPA